MHGNITLFKTPHAETTKTQTTSTTTDTTGHRGPGVNANTPLGVPVVHADVHEHVAHEAVAVWRAVVEQLAHHGVVEVVGRGVGDGLHHEHRVPQHVGVRRVDVAVDGVLHLGTELAGRPVEKR